MNNTIKVDGKILENSPLNLLSWFKVGGSAEYLYTPSSISDLQSFFKQVDKDMPITIIGNLSNVLIRDGGVKGYVIKLNSGEFQKIKIKNDVLEVGAGVINRVVCMNVCDNSLSGLEFLNFVPGTIGGAIRMNAGCYGGEIKDIFVSCKVMDRNGVITELNKEDIEFDHRYCSIDDDLIIISAVFKLEKKTAEEIMNNMEVINEKRINSQPIKEKTGGSTFKNPEGYSAWKLVDEAGLRGYSVGGAKISERHTNFIVNFNNATARDIEDLIELAKQKVYDKSGIMLDPEIKIIGNE